MVNSSSGDSCFSRAHWLLTTWVSLWGGEVSHEEAVKGGMPLPGLFHRGPLSCLSAAVRLVRG